METTAIGRNIELKSRIHDWDDAVRKAQQVATDGPTVLWQRDTYFRVAHGRLKLREITEHETARTHAELIWYQRDDLAEARLSDYKITPVQQPAILLEMLDAALGTSATVDKIRKVYFFHNVRIHLDEVENLGRFLELESVVQSDVSPTLARERLDYLVAQFGIEDDDILDRSYSDMAPDANRPSAGPKRLPDD